MEVNPRKKNKGSELKMSEENGVIYRISGPVVTAVGISPRMYEVVRVGDEGLKFLQKVLLLFHYRYCLDLATFPILF